MSNSTKNGECKAMERALSDLFDVCHAHKDCTDCPMATGGGYECAAQRLATSFFYEKRSTEV